MPLILSHSSQLIPRYFPGNIFHWFTKQKHSLTNSLMFLSLALLQHQFLSPPHQTSWPLPKHLVCSSCHLEKKTVLTLSSWLFISFQIQVQNTLYSLPDELSLFLPPPAVPALGSMKSTVRMDVTLTAWKENAGLAFSKHHKVNRKQMKISHYIEEHW